MQLMQLVQVMNPVLDEAKAPGREAWAAVALVSVSTLAGAWLARRNSKRLVVWLAIASATMLVIALTDLLPDAWKKAAETGLPLWVIGIAAATGFAVITYFTRKGCGHDHGIDSGRRSTGRHAPGRHRRLKEAVGAALFGGLGTAAALTTHRAIEGATLAFTASVVVVIALMVHSASEGLALAALLEIAKQRLAPWLVVSCVSPVVGVLFATVSPLPGRVVPVLLGMISGVLLRTAIVGIKLAASKQESGRLSKRHVTVATVIAVTVGALLTVAQAGEGAKGNSAQGPGGTQHPTGSVGADAQAALSPGSISRPDPLSSAGRSPTPASPQATPEPRRGTPANSTRARQDREELLAAMRVGRTTVAEVLQRDDATARHLRVTRLLKALPGYDPADAIALMATSGIDENRRLDGLNRQQRRALLDTLTGCARWLPPAHSPRGRPGPGIAGFPADGRTSSCAGPAAPHPKR
jgi:zinc transporter ZupT